MNEPPVNALEYEIDMRHRLNILDAHLDKMKEKLENEKDENERIEIRMDIDSCKREIDETHRDAYWFDIKLRTWKRKNKRPDQLKPV
jgi:hypothetical protein